ncbi:MAG: Abi family protein [Candidatus Marinimicrobia bacterium]|nr:Abi family protein [Candidatus Neomarinimicrobiota bacterium]
MKQYKKPALKIAQQIQDLRKKGLIIENEERVSRYLSFISFYRLRAYTYPFQNNKDSNHPFNSGITFDRILQTYLFDRKLRLLVFDAIERIEIALRTQIIYQYSIKHGSNWYENEKLFRKPYIFKHDINLIEKELKRSNEIFIKHYKKKYNKPIRPPAWMTLEIVSFGLLSKLYENLRLTSEKKIIARKFNLGHPTILESWMHSLSVIRNICAHHGRLWNREISASMKNPKITSATWLSNNDFPQGKMYLALSSIQFLLNTIIPHNHFKNKFKKLIKTYSEIPLRQMGFPKNWEKEKLWQNLINYKSRYK